MRFRCLLPSLSLPLPYPICINSSFHLHFISSFSLFILFLFILFISYLLFLHQFILPLDSLHLFGSFSFLSTFILLIIRVFRWPHWYQIDISDDSVMKTAVFGHDEEGGGGVSSSLAPSLTFSPPTQVSLHPRRSKTAPFRPHSRRTSRMQNVRIEWRCDPFSSLSLSQSLSISV